MLAPEPFFEPRGTPFSEYHRIKVLGELGYEVDLVTYPFGRDISMAHLRIVRSARPPFIRGVRIGPSMVKVLLDLLLDFWGQSLFFLLLRPCKSFHEIHQKMEVLQI